MARGTSASKARVKLAALKLPTLEESSLPNGLRIIAARRGPIPLVALRLVLQAGSAVDPSGKHGLADFTARLLRRGTRSRAADAIDEALEMVGATLGLSVAEDFTSLRITTPSEHLEAMLEVLGELVREPAFPEAEVESARSRTLAQLANDLDDPALLADRALSRALWSDHPYGHDVGGTVGHVKGFTREDAVRFHREAMGPKVAMLIAVGELDPKWFTAAAERVLGGWSGGPEGVVVPPSLTRVARQGQVVVVDKPEQTQSQVRLGGLSFPRGHPDQVPAQVANAVLGGGFTSRLVEEVRVNRGLSYGVGSSLDSLKVGGTFGISTFTKTETTREIIDVVLGEVQRLHKRGIPRGELERMQTYMAGLFPLRTETNEAIAGGIADIRLFGLPRDWIESSRERIHAVTPKQAAEAAVRWFLPEGPTLALVGQAEKIVKQVKDLGPVQVLKPTELE